jgi:hypothetical protein
LANGIGIKAPTAIVEDLVVRLAAGEAAEDEVLDFFKTYGYKTDSVQSIGGPSCDDRSA